MKTLRHRQSKQPYRGVARRWRKWIARIRVDYTEVYLGIFNTPEEAYAAYCKAQIEYHGATPALPSSAPPA